MLVAKASGERPALTPDSISNVVVIKQPTAELKKWARGALVYKDARERQHKAYTLTQSGVMYLPRGAASTAPFDFIVNDDNDKRSCAETEELPLKITLRGYQSKPVSKLIKAEQGILHAPTGAGKTAMSLAIAGQLGQRTLILVNSADLMQQWVDSGLKILGAKVGKIGGGVWEEGDQITVAMIQTLMRYEELPEEWLNSWGCTILDEAHRAPAATFSHVLKQVTSRYLYGVTATPTRQDGNHPMLHALIGRIEASVSEQMLVAEQHLVQPKVLCIESRFLTPKAKQLSNKNLNQWQRSSIYKQILDDLIGHQPRLMDVAKLAIGCYKNKKHILILSQRVEYLYKLEEKIQELHPRAASFVLTGRNTAQERTDVLDQVAQGHIRILLATSIADEGLDLPILDTLILTFPSKAHQKLQQQVGRIMRPYEGKTEAMVYDIVDSRVPVLRNQATRRWTWYETQGMETRGWYPAAAFQIKKAIEQKRKRKQ